jgi:hydroxypyruvate isomerase
MKDHPVTNGGAESASESSRRAWLKTAAGATGAVALSSLARAADDADAPVVKNGRIHQSLVNWCYRDHFADLDAFCAAAVQLGCESIELGDPADWPTLKAHGLTCAIAGSHGFPTGYNNPGEWEACTAKIRERIAQCVDFGVKRIITFTGMANGISKEDGADNFVKGIAPIVKEAEQAEIILCVEMLNTRDDSHPMKGHPGYQGDNIEYCIDLCNRINSPSLKLLFDIYHVQIMQGDVIRRIRQHKDYLGHIHTAGNPGRAELDATQEISYPAIMQALLEVGYDGYVGQEFIPTRDAMEGLREAVAVCDV